MKKWIVMLLVLALLTTGCHSGNPGETTPETETTAPARTEAVGTESLPENGALTFRDRDKLRVPYVGNQNGVRYITAPDQLPKNDAFAAFDETFFRENALVLVTCTLGSGSMEAEILSIEIHGETAQVSLDIRMPGGAGTSDMATWLLWAVVDRDLSYEWVLEAGADLPGLDKA